MNKTDIYVGNQIRIRRDELNMSQSDLAKPLGITFQQVQKYENGSNRVGGSRLHAIAEHLNVKDMNYFFPKQDCIEVDTVVTKNGVKFLKAFNKLTLNEQKAMINLMEVMNDE